MILSKLFLRFFMMLALIVLSACGDCGDNLDPNNGVLPDLSLTDVSDLGTSEPDKGSEDTSSKPKDGGAKNDTGFPDFAFDFPNQPDMEAEVFRLDAILPPSGPVDGGTSIVIQGSGFTRDTAVFFGSRQAEVILVDGNLTGLSPAGTAPGPVNIKVLHPTDGTLVLEKGFTYTETIRIDSVSPEKLPTSGGVEVTIKGKGFDSDARVSFGGQTGLRHVVASKTLIRVVAPPHTIGKKDVRVSSPIGSAIAFDAVTYFSPLRFDTIDPAAGLSIGGDSVTIRGQGFEPGMIVEFNGVKSPSVSVDPNGNRALVETPPGNPGLATLRLQTSKDALIVSDAFLFYSDPSLNIVAIQPQIGPISGGIEAKIIGVGLDEGSLQITLGGTAASIVSQANDHVIVTIPMHAKGVVDVVAKTSSKTSTLVKGFTYLPELTISSLNPSTGPTSGGTTVLIKGKGFTNVETVKFGSFAASFVLQSDTELVATTPPQNAGVVDLHIKRGALITTSKKAFTYTEDLAFYGFFPIKGSIAGNTYVELRGRGFAPGAEVSFDGVPAKDIKILDAQTIAVRSPEHAVGVATIKVTLDGKSVDSPFDYTYFDPGARFGGAWGDPINWAVNVTVYSTGGMPIENAFVMLSTNAQTPYQGVTNAAGLVTLSGPDVIGEQTVTAAASGYSSGSVQRVNAENITIFLSPPPQPQDPPPPGSAPAVFTGNISGLDKLAEPGPDEFQMAIVQTTKIDPYTRNPATGDGNVVLSNGEYALNSRFGDVAVIAVGGLYNNATQKFKPLQMGIKRFLFATSGETQVVDIDLNIPLNTVLTFKLSQIPSISGTPMVNRVMPYLDLGFEGVFGEMDTAVGTTDVIQALHQAPLTGVLADAKYYINGGVFGAGDLPQTSAILRNVVNTSQIINLPGFVGIANLTSPAASTAPVDRLYQFVLEQDQSPSFFYVMIQDTQRTPIWSVFLPGNERSFRLPDFPDFSHLPPEQRPLPYPGGLFVVDIVGFKKPPSFNYNNVSYNDLGISDVEAFSYSRRFVQF